MKIMACVLALGLAGYGATLGAQDRAAADRAELSRRYAAVLMSRIEAEWARPESVTLEQRCAVQVSQLPGGEVVDLTFRPDCEYDRDGRRSVERAVFKAAPLPYAGFESVFVGKLLLNFKAQDKAPATASVPAPPQPPPRRVSFRDGRPARLAAYAETCVRGLEAMLMKTNDEGSVIREPVAIAVAADGRIKQARIVRPDKKLSWSDSEFADMRVMYVRYAGVCPAFTPEILAEADLLEIETKLRLR